LTTRALGHCALANGARVLDLGCGAGVTVGHLRRALGLGAIGVDSSRKALERGSRRNAAGSLVQGSGSDLPLASGALTVVLAECSLSVMPERERVWRVLAVWPRGRLVITACTPAARRRRAPPLAAGGVRRGDDHAKDLTSALEEQGFRVDVWEDPLPANRVRLPPGHGGRLSGSMGATRLSQDEDTRIVGPSERARLLPPRRDER
jgi:SAM-dependent methyltransferase